MKAIVKIEFIDLKCDCHRFVGDVFEADAERIEELANNKHGRLVEPIDEADGAEEKPKPKPKSKGRGRAKKQEN